MSENPPDQPTGDQQPSGSTPPPGDPSTPPGYPGPASPAPYGQPQGYGQPGYGQGYPPPAPGYGGGFRPKHPQATTVLVLGILGLVLCQLFAPFAWVMGNRVVKEIDANPSAYDGRSEANAGRICGIIGTILMAIVILLLVGLFVFGAVLSTAGSSVDSDFSLIGSL